MKGRMARLAMVMAVAALGSLSISAEPAAAASTPKITSTINENIWAGYSAYPAKGFIYDEEANWGIPKVTCPASPLDSPRAAVWVGMWGSLGSLKGQNGWLPQIGTASDCGGLHPTYSVVWEMESQVSGGGNRVQYGLDCPGNKTYSLCGNLTSVSPGDVVNAAVNFEGPYTAKAAKRKFEIRITDLTTGDYAVGQIVTNKRVKIGQIADQGGVIVEDNPPCSWSDILLLKCVVPARNGLARFAGGITIGTVYTSVGGAPANTALRYIKWVMKSKGHQLAKDGQLAVVDGTMNFSVAWQRRY
jgi:hypothetical protein